jgi:NAD+ diphosphatase
MPLSGEQLAPLPTPPFSGATLDRVADMRDDAGAITELVARPDAVWVAAAGSGVLIETEDEGTTLLRLPGPALTAADLPPVASEALLLGIEDAGRPVFALDLETLPETAKEQLTGAGRLVTLRDAGRQLRPGDGGLAAYLVALLNWHRRHGFCANCGAATAIAEAGLSRRCPSCGSSHFPRTDPVVIMSVSNGDRLLLGRRHGWDAGRFSILAGFISVGETPEEAVVREVLEEASITAYAPRYVAAQPWPFPSSLMLGYDALAHDGEPIPQPGEMAEVAWFGLDEVTGAQRGDGKLILPPPVSIARLLIDRWVAAHSP